MRRRYRKRARSRRISDAFKEGFACASFNGFLESKEKEGEEGAK